MPHDNARRGFLRKSIAVLPAAALATGGCGKADAPAATGVPSSPAGTAPGATSASAYQPKFFNAAEWAFVQAAVARLIPADATGPGAVESGVHEFIDRQMDAVFGHAANWYMQGPFVDSPPEFGYQGKLPPRDVYRAGIAAADTHCRDAFGGKTFAQLDAARQDQVLKGLESGEVKFDDVSAKTFFAFLLQNTKEGYLSDPMHGGNKDAGAWKMIGFPGARADFADWVGKPVQYPLPPVSINGPQG
jgi:gluconate 2-dehydrogenase gamma chain